ncbi:MAG: S-adenosyl-l-methionine hydroxide adenosyltransferase [Candidatus Methanohalarchaeum thermophilum]|uniref:S-adenosyl-l-methionine hydroxide adenosyltransferase n=1 Tax=Methanohalarchaeum thermophilum TaxID=1903181 RepID=A0A1Q6DTB5_METT1|nr:MAG: S-adenosyl-l-methionine hydroxide adenosyltransferase [Candidatus Methanohalarchaeum thermophilum]
MKGIAGGISGSRLIDICHDVPRHDIEIGAFILKSVVEYFPQGTVHVGVVDPGVGSEREGLAIKAGNQYLVGPDNGLLIPAARELGPIDVHLIENEEFFLSDVSETFHGRDVFTPVGANLAEDIYIGDIGKETSEYVELEFKDWEKDEDVLRVKVINIDSFGNVITNVPKEEIELGLIEKVKLFDREMRVVDYYSQVNKGDPVLTVGGHGFLEISVNQGSAKKLFDIDIGDKVEIIFLD